MRTSIILSVTAGVCLSVLSVRGVEPPGIQTSLQSLGLDTSIPDVRVVGGETRLRMNVQAFRIGRAVSYRGPELVRFYAPGPEVDAEEEERLMPIGEVQLNPAWSQTLLLWTRTGGDQYAITALPNDLKALPADHLRFLNTTHSRLGVKMKDGEPRILAPGEQFSVRANGSEAIYFWSMMEGREGGAQLLSNVVEMRPGMRRTVFLTFDNAAATGNDGVGPKRFSFFVLTHR